MEGGIFGMIMVNKNSPSMLWNSKIYKLLEQLVREKGVQEPDLVN